MMQLNKIVISTGKPLPQCNNLVPSVVALWNSLKGGIDDLSKTLSHNLGKWGTIAPTSLLIIRVFSSLMYNAWRLYSLAMVSEYLNSDKCKSYSRYQKERIRKGWFPNT
jgi:predicted ferric reductase